MAQPQGVGTQWDVVLWKHDHTEFKYTQFHFYMFGFKTTTMQKVEEDPEEAAVNIQENNLQGCL